MFDNRKDYNSQPATNGLVGLNELEWRPDDGWTVKDSKKRTQGQIDAFTSLMPIQYGKTKAVVFYWTIKVKGSELLPQDSKWSLQWAIPLSDGSGRFQ